MLTRYACGHIGRMNYQGMTTGKARPKAFIRVAEIRDEKVEESSKQCPDCHKESK